MATTWCTHSQLADVEPNQSELLRSVSTCITSFQRTEKKVQQLRLERCQQIRSEVPLPSQRTSHPPALPSQRTTPPFRGLSPRVAGPSHVIVTTLRCFAGWVQLLRRTATELIRAVVPFTRRPRRLSLPGPPLPASDPSHVRRQHVGSAAFAAVQLAPRAGAQEPWTTEKAMPNGAEDLPNARAGFDDSCYMNHGTPSTGTAGEASKCATLTNAWTTGNTSCMRPPRSPSRAALARTAAFVPCAMNACSHKRTMHRP